jgi:hypothetical protein
MNHRGIWLTTAVLAVAVLLAQVAGAATREMPGSASTTASVSAELTGTTPTVTLPEQASSVAKEKAATGLATANSHQGETATTETRVANEVTANTPAAAPKDSTRAAGTLPGWGCGDTNHTHSGPPGRPSATPPQGCARP